MPAFERVCSAREMKHGIGLQLTALFFVAFNLRVAMACIGPLLEHLRIDLVMSRAQLGLLSTLPVLCMGLFAPFAQRLSAARGHESVILYATILISLSALIRVWADAALLLISAFSAGVGIAIVGTLLNTFVKQHFADRALAVSGLYSAALCLGAALAAGITAPLAEWLESWRISLAIWSLPGALGAALWFIMLKRSPTAAVASVNQLPAKLPWGQRKAWLVMVFFGLQSVTFYVVLAWLAPMYMELGWTAARAGALLSYWIAAQVVFILIVSQVANRSLDRRPMLIACGVAACIGMSGFASAPLNATWVWILLLGFASGGWFPLAMTLPLDFSKTPNETGSWTAMMLFGGYLISAGAPSLAGWARDGGTSYSAIFAAMAILSAVLALLAIFLRPQIRAVNS
jgi:CP family cyanate transporter-like MFS transporter